MLTILYRRISHRIMVMNPSWKGRLRQLCGCGNIQELSKKERENGGVLDVDVNTVSTITSHKPGYLDKDKEQIVGLQTDEPFKRSIQPFGGIRMMKDACDAYGFELPEEIIRIFTDIRKTHNQGVFDAYTPERCVQRVKQESSQDCRMHMVVAGSSATIAE